MISVNVQYTNKIEKAMGSTLQVTIMLFLTSSQLAIRVCMQLASFINLNSTGHDQISHVYNTAQYTITIIIHKIISSTKDIDRHRMLSKF